MSTDHQKYSIENQREAIGEYAFLHNMEIVRTYADEGRSGVSIKRRDALKRLLADVQKGNIDFDVILVYDVSRWGRFQDVDESAHYEFICKAAGISVVYCAELFENNGSALSALVKVMKRVMAGEYSRELSAKISRAHRFHAARGFHQGGPPNFGLNRVLVDENAKSKTVLQDGEQKSFFGDRVILAPGPEDEIRIVREIFRMYAVDRMSQREIVRELNQRGVRNRRGNPWSSSNVSKMLANEKYGGTFVYGRSKWPLTGGHMRTSPRDWIRVRGAIEAIVPRDIFDKTQLRLSEGPPWTDTDLLNYLTAAWCTDGYLSIPSVNRNGVCPTAPTYRDHFGHITDAYRLIGYKQVHAYRYSKISGNMRHVHRTTLSQLISAIKSNAIVFDEKEQVLRIDDSMTVAVFVLPYLKRNPLLGWKLYFERVRACDAIFLVRMEKTNMRPLDFHLLPRDLFNESTYRFTEDRIKKLKPYKLRSLSEFERAVKRIRERMQSDPRARSEGGHDSAGCTIGVNMGRPTHRRRKKLTAKPATKSEDVLVERLVAREAHAIAAGAPVIPKEVVDMVVNGVHPIRAFRVHRGMTQTQLCAAAKITQNHLSNLENARVTPKASTLKKLALALDVPQDLLTPIK